MYTRQGYRKVYCFVLITLWILTAAEAGHELRGLIGCTIERELCLDWETCVDDCLFGQCKAPEEGLNGEYCYDLTLPQKQAVEVTLRTLLGGGFSWEDLYTQCIMGSLLLSIRSGEVIDPSVCGRWTPPSLDDWIESVPRKKEEEDFINVHKYFADNKRNRQQQQPYSDEGPVYESEVEGGDSEEGLTYSGILQNVLSRLDNVVGVPTIDYMDNSDLALDQSDVEPVEGLIPGDVSRLKSIDVVDPDDISPADAKVFDDLMNNEVSVNDLDDATVDRLWSHLSKLWDSVKERREHDTDTDQPKGDSETQIVEEKRGDQDLGPESLESSVATPLKAEKQKYDIVNGNLAYIKVTPTDFNANDATKILYVLEKVLNLADGSLSTMIKLDSGERGWIVFGVFTSKMKAAEIAKEALRHADQIRNETGYSIIDAGEGDETSYVSVEDIDPSPKYFMLMFILCGAVAGTVVAVIAIFIYRRHTLAQWKIKNMTATGEGEAACKDYQDLCRHHMQSKTSDRPEPVHVARAVGQTTASRKSPHSSHSSTSSWSEEPAPSNMDISTGHVVLAYMEDHLHNKDRLGEEWEALMSYEADPCATTAACEPGNSRKNRYTDILPYDHSRVTLNKDANINESDYINASFITDHDPRSPAYIATQGPLPHTVADFWQMVWEQGSVAIVNLTKLTENGAAMSHRYWPEEGSELYHIFEVHLVSEHMWCDDYMVRSLYLKNLQTGETRTVTQFHFLTWPDLDIPASVKALLDFRRKVNKSYRGRSCPIIVHCSDGCGRTGTYCLVDMVLNRINKGAKEIDIAATLEHIRDQRMQTVRTKAQFEFALGSVAEEVSAILGALPKS